MMNTLVLATSCGLSAFGAAHALLAHAPPMVVASCFGVLAFNVVIAFAPEAGS